MRYQVNRDKRRRRLFYLSEEARVFSRIGFFECRFNKKTRAIFYKDLVKEIQMTKDEKKRVMNIWRDIRQKESGSDAQQVARAA